METMSRPICHPLVERCLAWALGTVLLVPLLDCRRQAAEPPAPAHDAESSPAIEAPAAPEEPPPAAPGPAAALPRPLPVAPPEQLEEYTARRPKTVFELQPYRVTHQAQIEDAAGRSGRAKLVDLAPGIHDWMVLDLEWAGGRGGGTFHLENPIRTQQVLLDPAYLFGLVLVDGDRRRPCDLWSGGEAGALAAARGTRRTWASLCDERLYLRNRTAGRKTTLEWATDLLRDHVWRGEQVTVFVREKLYKDAYLETSEVIFAGDPASATARPRPRGGPQRPLVDPAYDASYLVPAELGLSLEYEVPGQVLAGRWYPVRDLPGVFVSTLRANMVAPEVIAELRGMLNSLDEVELSALVYMVAFDLEDLELGFTMGTDHPRVGWSERALPAVRDDRLPGPDGIGSVEPLVMTGMVAPAGAERTVATFIGGFKRTHGAFRSGDLATKNSGSHYGFVEHGAVLSKLQPGLATAVVYEDGRVDLKTWTAADDSDLPRIRHARQNGVALIEPDPETGLPRPGELVPRWGTGNWSGSVDRRLRSLRAGLCLQESDAGTFLLYGYFSSATPSAMARVFQAYRCRYAMLLDMNALEHTYLALYRVRSGRFLIQHLIDGMDVLDKVEGDQELPRFVGFADNRDFFSLLRKEPS